MPEKLLTLKEASELLDISEDEVSAFVEKGELPAYRIGGRFLRFRQEQIEAIRREIPRKAFQKPLKRDTSETEREKAYLAKSQSPLDKIADFFYFNDFYIVSAALITLILLFIFK